ncbi:MAG TPA: hypothetical protein VGO86_18490 [Candidatus Dormibacteraeota bacterium]
MSVRNQLLYPRRTVPTDIVSRPPGDVRDRLERTVAILERRGYAVTPARLGELCLGGALAEPEVGEAMAGGGLCLRDGLVVSPGLAPSTTRISRRAASHADNAARCLPVALGFVRSLVRLCPFVLSVSIAGSLASGGYMASDDVDLNLIVEDGKRHLAYVAVNVLGVAHALRHRGKPVDTHTRRPLAPRFMTANLIIERSQCFPLDRQDEDMAYEFMASMPVAGIALWRQVVATNPGLSEHFPQLQERRFPCAMRDRPALPGWLFPAALDAPAEAFGRAAWRYMQWTRRRRPEALARVAFVRRTMRPYALFDER